RTKHGPQLRRGAQQGSPSTHTHTPNTHTPLHTCHTHTHTHTHTPHTHTHTPPTHTLRAHCSLARLHPRSVIVKRSVVIKRIDVIHFSLSCHPLTLSQLRLKRLCVCVCGWVCVCVSDQRLDVKHIRCKSP